MKPVWLIFPEMKVKKTGSLLNSADEVEKLYEAGADELYCGFFDVEWQKSYGRHDSISRRQGEANYASFDELAKTVYEAS